MYAVSKDAKHSAMVQLHDKRIRPWAVIIVMFLQSDSRSILLPAVYVFERPAIAFESRQAYMLSDIVSQAQQMH